MRLLSVLATTAAVPLLALAAHAPAAGHAGHGHAERALPHNLCSSCHGGGQAAWEESRLVTADLAATRDYLTGVPRG